MRKFLKNILDVISLWEQMLQAEQKRLSAKEYIGGGLFDIIFLIDDKRYQRLEKARLACVQIKERIAAVPDKPDLEEELPRQLVAELFPRGLMSALYLLYKSPSDQKKKTFCALAHLGELYFCK